MEVVGAVEIDRVDIAAGHEHLQVDDLRALQIEHLQLVRCERDVFAAVILVPLEDLVFIEFFAAAWIVRPEGDASSGAYSSGVILDPVGRRPRRG
jgi:hypothetical protein